MRVPRQQPRESTLALPGCDVRCGCRYGLAGIRAQVRVRRGSVAAVDRDTSLEAEQVQAEAQRALGPGRRLEIAIAMSEEARSLLKRRLRHQLPELGEAALGRALIEELYGIRVGRG